MTAEFLPIVCLSLCFCLFSFCLPKPFFCECVCVSLSLSLSLSLILSLSLSLSFFLSSMISRNLECSFHAPCLKEREVCKSERLIQPPPVPRFVTKQHISMGAGTVRLWRGGGGGYRWESCLAPRHFVSAFERERAHNLGQSFLLIYFQSFFHFSFPFFSPPFVYSLLMNMRKHVEWLLAFRNNHGLSSGERKLVCLQQNKCPSLAFHTFDFKLLFIFYACLTNYPIRNSSINHTFQPRRKWKLSISFKLDF